MWRHHALVADAGLAARAPGADVIVHITPAGSAPLPRLDAEAVAVGHALQPLECLPDPSRYGVVAVPADVRAEPFAEARRVDLTPDARRQIDELRVSEVDVRGADGRRYERDDEHGHGERQRQGTRHLDSLIAM